MAKIELATPYTVTHAGDFQMAYSPAGKTINVQWWEGIDAGTKITQVKQNGYTFRDGEDDLGNPITEFSDLTGVATQDGETLGAALNRILTLALSQKGYL